jgi:hypothetical protein
LLLLTYRDLKGASIHGSIRSRCRSGQRCVMRILWAVLELGSLRPHFIRPLLLALVEGLRVREVVRALRLRLLKVVRRRRQLGVLCFASGHAHARFHRSVQPIVLETRVLLHLLFSCTRFYHWLVCMVRLGLLVLGVCTLVGNLQHGVLPTLCCRRLIPHLPHLAKQEVVWSADLILTRYGCNSLN